MLKKSLALAVVSTMVALSGAPAEAGPLREKLKSGAKKAALLGIVVGACVEKKITGRPSFVCPR